MKSRFLRVFKRTKRERHGSLIEPITAVDIETTTYCNRRCIYCPNSIFERSLKKNERLMSPALFQKIVDELAAMSFSGRMSPHLYGEPLTDSRLVSFMRYAHVKLPRATLVIYTNGDYFTTTLLDQLYDAGVQRYIITVHNENVPSQIDSINRIKQLKKHTKHYKKNVNLQYLTCNDLHLVNRGGLIETRNQGPPPWSCEDEALAINYRGDVLICCNDYLGVTAFGNLQQESLSDIWSKPEFVNIRRELKRNSYTLDICRKCTHSLASHVLQ